MNVYALTWLGRRPCRARERVGEPPLDRNRDELVAVVRGTRLVEAPLLEPQIRSLGVLLRRATERPERASHLGRDRFQQATMPS
jgi:hypothetical protein